VDPTGPAIEIDAFSGPMDLLLHLVRAHEVDIHDIPIAQIADQYARAIGDLRRVDIETAGEFLVLAATLAEIKSRVIAAEQAAPSDSTERPDAGEEQPTDPRAQLVRQLVEYKRLRDRAAALELRERAWRDRACVAPAGRPAGGNDQPAGHDDDQPLDLEDLSLADLVEAFERIAAAIQFDRLGEHAIEADDTPIELHQADAIDRLERAQAEGGRPVLALADLFTGRSRADAIGMFLAILELIRDRRLTARRHASGGDVWIELRQTDASGNDANADGGGHDGTSRADG